MQLTHFDRWLREKYVYETHIHTLRPPESLPEGVRAVEIPDVPGKRYKHLFVASSSKAADALISQLRQNSQMYTTAIVDRSEVLNRTVDERAPDDELIAWLEVLLAEIKAATPPALPAKAGA